MKPGDRIRRVPVSQISVTGDRHVDLWDARRHHWSLRYSPIITIVLTVIAASGFLVAMAGAVMVGNEQITGRPSNGETLIGVGAAMLPLLGSLCIAAGSYLASREDAAERRAYLSGFSLDSVSGSDIARLLSDDQTGSAAREALASFVDRPEDTGPMNLLARAASTDRGRTDPSAPRRDLIEWYRKAVSTP